MGWLYKEKCHLNSALDLSNVSLLDWSIFFMASINPVWLGRLNTSRTVLPVSWLNRCRRYDFRIQTMENTEYYCTSISVDFRKSCSIDCPEGIFQWKWLMKKILQITVLCIVAIALHPQDVSAEQSIKPTTLK